jgi:hypothetical protein
MTDLTAALDAESSSPRTPSPSTSARITHIAGLVGGAAFVVDTVTITAINSSFGVLDDAMLFVGLGGLAITAVSLAVYVSGRATGAARIGLGTVTFVGLMVVLGVVAQLMDSMGRHVFSDANIGLHGEWSFFTIGLCLLGIAVWTRHRSAATVSDGRGRLR